MEKVNNKTGEVVVEVVTSSGSDLYYPIKYKWSEEDKCMVPYFDKPLNRYEMIQAAKDSTDIHAIINRVKLGDISVLNVNPPINQGDEIVDVSNIPDNINEATQLQSSAINQFYSLDPNIRALFDNDVSKFSKAISDGTYISIINDSLKPKEEVSEDAK